MINLNRVSKHFEAFTALEDCSAVIPDGSIYGLIGYNGAGKTTLLNLISGLYKPSSGRITVDAEDKSCDPFDNPQVKRQLYYVSDDPYFLPYASLNDMRDFYRGFYSRFSTAGFDRLVKLFRLDPEKRIADFSKGMKRQAAIILGLSSRVRYLLLDESFDGLDPNMRGLVSSLLTEYLLEVGGTVIAASHNLPELEKICDSIGMINDKHMIFSGDIDDIRASAKKYRVCLRRKAEDGLLASLQVKNCREDHLVYTFSSREKEEIIKARLSDNNEILLFEAVGMSLNEIFKAEMGEGEESYEGIFDEA